MVQNMISQQEEQRLMKVFNSLDTNGDGHLDYDELCTGLTRLYGEEYAVEECDRIFSTIDVDNNGTIEFTEYLLASANK